MPVILLAPWTVAAPYRASLSNQSSGEDNGRLRGKPPQKRQSFRREEHGVCSVDARPARRRHPGCRRPGQPRPERGRFLQGQERRSLYRLQRRRRLRPLCADGRQAHRQAHPRQPDRDPEEHGGRRLAPARQLALQRRPQGRLGDGHHRARHRLRSAARQHQGAVRRPEVHLDRQRQQRGLDLRRLAHLRRHQVRGPADQGAGCRRHQRVRRHRPVPEDRQRRARHQDEGRHRLSRRQRGRPRHGARRGAGPLRLVVVEREVDPPEMDRRQAVHHPGPARARQASRPARRAAGHRSRQDPRAAADPAADLRPPGDGPAVPGAARHPGRPRRGAAQGFHGHHDRQGFPRRHREGADGNQPGVRREADRAGHRNLRDAEGAGRPGRRSSRGNKMQTLPSFRGARSADPESRATLHGGSRFRARATRVPE